MPDHLVLPRAKCGAAIRSAPGRDWIEGAYTQFAPEHKLPCQMRPRCVSEVHDRQPGQRTWRRMAAIDHPGAILAQLDNVFLPVS